MPVSAQFRVFIGSELISDEHLAIIYSCLAVGAAVLIAGLVVKRLRSWVQSNEDLPAGGFHLHDLRALHRAGKISNEEFEKARAMIIDAAKKASEKSPLKPPPKL